MKELIVWGPGLETGIVVIDQDHRKLVGMLNRLNAAMAEGHAKDVLAQLLNELVQYTVVHFQHEEQLMAKHQYAGTAGHASEHRKLVATVSDFKNKLALGQAMISIELMKFLRGWLTDHIMGADKRLAQALLAAGAH